MWDFNLGLVGKAALNKFHWWVVAGCVLGHCGNTCFVVETVAQLESGDPVRAADQVCERGHHEDPRPEHCPAGCPFFLPYVLPYPTLGCRGAWSVLWCAWSPMDVNRRLPVTP